MKSQDNNRQETDIGFLVSADIWTGSDRTDIITYFFLAVDDKERRKHGGQNCGSGNTGDTKLKEHHKYNVKKHICNPGQSKSQKRITAVAAGPENCRTKIIKQQKGITDKIDLKIKNGGVKDIRWCFDEAK